MHSESVGNFDAGGKINKKAIIVSKIFLMKNSIRVGVVEEVGNDSSIQRLKISC